MKSFKLNLTSKINLICFSGEFTYTSDTILSALASKQTLMASKDHQKISQMTSEQRTFKQEGGCSGEYIYEDDEETDSSTETIRNSRLHKYGLPPLTSSPHSEEAGAAGGKDAVFASLAILKLIIYCV